MRTLALVVLAACAAASLNYWWQRGQSVAPVDAPRGRIACISYAPYRLPGQSPFVAGTRIPAAQIRADLERLARRVRCVRTYSVSQGLAEVPRIARSLGLEVLLGVWIGRDDRANERELARAIEAANREPDTVRAVIVGNEVLLRREQPPERLRAMIERVRAAVPQPVTYADVWEFWVRHRELAAGVSFVTVHILPYWEDQPVPVERAVDHLLQVYGEVQRALPGKPIFVGETGWPSAGRDREGASPGRINQARYVREFLTAAAGRGMDYNLIEAFDQPWKRDLEGTVGGHWGLLDASGHDKFPLQGALAEDPEWYRGWVAAAIVAGLMILGERLAGRRYGPSGVAALALAGAACGATLYAQFRYLAESSRTVLEWAIGGALTAGAAVAAVLLSGAVAQLVDASAESRKGARRLVPPLRPAAEAIAPRAGAPRAAGSWLGLLRFAFLFAAAGQCLMLVFDARYRGFPVALYAIPAAGFALLGALSEAHRRTGVEERLLAGLLVVAAPLIAAQETLANSQAIAWCATCLLFGGPVLGQWLAREYSRERQHA
ncbi:MAG: glycoside hydrolase family 17 [Burkholderiales bacterium]|nr:glycoside hydrolase family 17 [Burkholderiales bacterium]